MDEPQGGHPGNLPKFGHLGLNISAPRAPTAKKFIMSVKNDQGPVPFKLFPF